VLVFTFVDTILGKGTLVSSNQGLCYFSFYHDLTGVKRWLSAHFPKNNGLTMAPVFPCLVDATRQLNEYLAGQRHDFTFPLDLKGTGFQIGAWQALLGVPYGATTTYSELAMAIGRPRAARAIGNAMRANPVPVFVPCHRVLPANNSLGGYGGGQELKRWLLQLEGVSVKC